MTVFSGRRRHANPAEQAAPFAASPTTSTMSVHHRTRPTPAVTAVQVLVVLALVPLTVFYLVPRLYNLTATPSRLDQAVVSANNYNPALSDLVAYEKQTLAVFTALEKMETALASVHTTDAAVSDELDALIGQINGDLHRTLDLAGANVTNLVSSLDALTTHVNSLQAPIDIATGALDANTATMQAVLDDARATAHHVHRARLSAEESANDLSGR